MFEMPLLDVAHYEPEQLAGCLPEISQFLRELDFIESRVVDLLEARSLSDLLERPAEYVLRSEHLLADLLAAPAGILTQLFVRNGPVAQDVYRAGLPRELRRLAETLGLVRVADTWVRGSSSISPLSSRHFLSDQLFTLDGSGNPVFRWRSDMVMPPHSSTMSLRENLDRGGQWDHLVDIGCGCGVLGIDLRSRYGTVTAVDHNPRAVAYTRANAMLNDTDVTAETVDITKERVPIAGPSHLIFNSPTMIPYRPDVGEPGMMTPELALRQVLRQLPTDPPAGGLAQVYMIIEVPDGCPSAEQVVAHWLARTRVARFEVRELTHSPASVTVDMIRTRSVEPRCLLLRNATDGPLLADYLSRRGTREVVPAVVSVWR